MSGMPVLAVSRRPYAPSQDTLRLALGAAHAGVWEWHLADNRNDWSTEVWDLYGLPRDVQPGFDGWLQGIHPEDQARACQEVVEAGRQGLPFELEWRTHPDHGPVRWLMSRGQPVPAAKGPGRYIGIVMDITDRKQAELMAQQLNAQLEQRVQERTAAVEEHERLLQTILDGMPGMVSYWTHDQRNLFANKAYADWLGKSPDELRNLDLKQALGEQLYALKRPQIEAALLGTPQHFERNIPVPGHPGLSRQAEVSYFPDIHEGQVRGMLVLVFDVSAARRGELAAETANEAKRDFLAAVSHELRTPLHAMFGLAQLGSRQAQGTPAQPHFEHILTSAQHLLTLLNDMLDFSKIEAGKLTLQPERVALGQVLEQVLSLKTQAAQAKGLHLQVVEGPAVPARLLCDPTRLAQVLINLLSNAIRYTDQGEVTLRIDVAGQELCLDVSDTGIGMSTQQLAQLFKPFVQVHRIGTHREGGSGLGLAITQRLIDLMGGHISVSSSPGRGSQFQVRLPLVEPEAEATADLGPVGLVALEADARETLQSALQQRGCVVHCTDGPDAPSCRDARVVVLSPHAAQTCSTELLRQWREAGATIVISNPTNAPIDTPPDLPSIHLVGPLTPLRLMNALRQHLKPSPLATESRLPHMRILAAEDNPVNRLVLGQMLEQEGALVTFANDGAQAVDAVRQWGEAQFDIVLCDIQMPVMDGYEATRAIKAIAPTLPVVGLTAHAFASAKQQAQSAGMVDYVTKPYLLDTLVKVLRDHARPSQQVASSQTVSSQTPAPSNMPSASFSHGGTPDVSSALSDFAAMQAHFRTQPLLLERLLGMLDKTLTDVERELSQAIATSDMTALARVAHNIKGTALNLHTPELTRCSVLTQDMARSQDLQVWPHAQALLNSLRQFLNDAARARQPN